MGDIYFEGSDDYNKKLGEIYRKIKNNDVGRVIIDEIKACGDEIYQDFREKFKDNVVPAVLTNAFNVSKSDLSFVPRDQGRAALHGRCNAETQAQNTRDAAPGGVSANGPALWYRGDEDNPNTPDDERYTLMPNGAGTGRGSDVKIYFDPDEYVKSLCDRKGPGSLPDELLLHEMVHALRSMQGKSNPIPTDNQRYDNDEEFLAIVVTNVYISAKGGGTLRADHWAHKALGPPLNTSAGFLTDPDNLKLMKTYLAKWGSTFVKLAGLRSPLFNPFRQLRGRLETSVGGS